MKLIQTVMRGWVIPPDKNLKSCLSESIFIDCQNVHEWVLAKREHGKIYDLRELCPLARLPFNAMWFEWEHGLKIGVLGLQNENQFALQFFGLNTEEDKKAITWGTLIFDTDEEYNLQKISAWCPDESFMQFVEQIKGLAQVPLSAISFFHCKNVKFHRVERPPRLQKKIDRETGAHVPSPHIIDIHLNMERNIYERSSEHNYKEIRSHLVRGHFKRYDKQKLFGRVQGMWFWSQHLAGTGKAITIADYRVHGPKKNHESVCIVER